MGGTFEWHTSRKEGRSLRCPWITISQAWLQVAKFASFNLGSCTRISFWHDNWLISSPLSTFFPRLIRITLIPNGLVFDQLGFKYFIMVNQFQKIFKRRRDAGF